MLHYENFPVWPKDMKLKELYTVAHFVTLNGVSKDDMHELVKFGDAIAQENEKLRKAFALTCRALADEGKGHDTGCPCAKECSTPGDPRCCSKCIRDSILSYSEERRVCRVCGCTDDNACPGGCYWVERNLCSACKLESEDETRKKTDGGSPHA